MSDTWEDIQAVKNKRNSYRERLEKRKKERQDILGTLPSSLNSSKTINLESTSFDDKSSIGTTFKWEAAEVDPEFERSFLVFLSDRSLILPINSKQIVEKLIKQTKKSVAPSTLHYYIQKYSTQQVISVQDVSIDNESGYEVLRIDHAKVDNCLQNDIVDNAPVKIEGNKKRKYETEEIDADIKPKIEKKSTKERNVTTQESDIMSLLSLPSTKEKQSKQVGVEILELLSKPTAKERSLAEKFKSQGGAQVMEFCPYGTKVECEKNRSREEPEEENDENKEIIKTETTPIKEDPDKEEGEMTEDDKIEGEEEEEVSRKVDSPTKCNKVHFKKIIQQHTDESLGDCSFLNTCFHMDSCKYVHYEVDDKSVLESSPKVTPSRVFATSKDNASNLALIASPANQPTPSKKDSGAILYPTQWIQCDLRYLDMTVLGKFAVIMADPPWDIHMELPYGTMSDDEMRQLGIPALQDDGLIFLWVTGRAMELGRECLKLWGYERVDEIIWVKTNQLQRIIRTGRTGHWLNHGKEHCLVGMKGNPTNLNRGLDCDVIVAEVRATSHKPDEIYGIIERLSPGTRKIELFGRPHNVQPNWITLGNQLDGIRLVDPELISSFQKRYPDGNCMAPKK
ncbi:N6-adenosine-methyltransferase MT-A70-like protein [Culicoides brevitarsis]|uniref:N6-adenosine-methyltransferase MT-A70-like protein n=1 Tax=Culicoides brevitarsis TaxID=469753 RepID=UPI00307B4398